MVLDAIHNGFGSKVGTRMLDVMIDQNARLFDYVRGNPFVILFFTGTKTSNELDRFVEIKDTIKHLYKDEIKFILIEGNNNALLAWNDIKIEDAHAKIHQRYGIIKPTLYLIRPDKYIGFRGGVQHEKELLAYLEFLN